MSEQPVEQSAEEESLIPSPIKQPPIGRVLIVVILTLLPWPAVWYGMYELRSIMWSFVLYHFVCLLPAIIWGYPLWRRGLKLPTRKQWIYLIGAALFGSLLSWGAYTYFGSLVIDRADVMKVLTARGYTATWLLPMGLYFVLINALLEELFWRGVVLNELDYLNQRLRFAGEAWTALAFCAWHWLVLHLLLRPVWAEAAVLSILLVGILCSMIYRKTGSLLLAVLWHALVFDLALIVVLAIL